MLRLVVLLHIHVRVYYTVSFFLLFTEHTSDITIRREHFWKINRAVHWQESNDSPNQNAENQPQKHTKVAVTIQQMTNREKEKKDRKQANSYKKWGKKQKNRI